MSDDTKVFILVVIVLASVFLLGYYIGHDNGEEIYQSKYIDYLEKARKK